MKTLYDSSYLAFNSDGTLSIADGVGYVDEMSETETRKLYEALHKYFGNRPAPPSEGGGE